MSEYLLDDEDVDELADKQRHQEMMAVWGRIANALENQNEEKSSNEELQELLSTHKGMIADFLKKVKEISQPQTPNVNVEVNQKDVIASVEQSSKSIVDALNTFSSNINNYIEAINAPKTTIARITQRNSLGFADEIILKTILK